VNSADLQILLAGLNRAGAWDQGDFNYDGQVNSADLQDVLFTLNTNLGSEIAAATYAAATPISATTSQTAGVGTNRSTATNSASAKTAAATTHPPHRSAPRGKGRSEHRH
jgi:hypothetical protein